MSYVDDHRLNQLQPLLSHAELSRLEKRSEFLRAAGLVLERRIARKLSILAAEWHESNE